MTTSTPNPRYFKDAPPLSHEVLESLFEQIRNAPPHPCSIGRHVVSASALREGRQWATCANCGRTVKIHDEGDAA